MTPIDSILAETEFGEAIAERSLTLIEKNGETRDVVVRIGAPQPDDGAFFCRYQISLFEPPGVKRIRH